MVNKKRQGEIMNNQLKGVTKEEALITQAIYDNNKILFEMIKPHIQQLIGLTLIEIREGERHHAALVASQKSSIEDCTQ